MNVANLSAHERFLQLEDALEEIERLLRCVASIEDALSRKPPRVGDALYVCEVARAGVTADNQQQTGEK